MEKERKKQFIWQKATVIATTVYHVLLLNHRIPVYFFSIAVSFFIVLLILKLSIFDFGSLFVIVNQKGALRDLMIVLVPIQTASLSGAIMHLMSDTFRSNHSREFNVVTVIVFLVVLAELLDVTFFLAQMERVPLTADMLWEAEARIYIALSASIFLEVLLLTRIELIELRGKGAL